MDRLSLIPVELLPDVFWLEFTLKRPLDAAGIEDWQIRCMRGMSEMRLRALVSPSLIVAMGIGHVITADERNEVILWLLTQPEVVIRDVRVGGQLAGSGVAGRPSRG